MTDQTTTPTRPTYYDVYGSDDEFLMRTTLRVLTRVLDLHKDAVRRLAAETKESGGVCSLHFNGRPNPLGEVSVTVQEAVGPRANY